MSTLHESHDANAHAMAAHDANFDHFIDSNLILDPNSPMATPGTPLASSKKEAKSKPTPLSSLPARLSSAASMDRQASQSPRSAANEFLTYTHSSNSAVTTPTTSNSSGLNTLNFDFFDANDNDSAEGTAVPIDNGSANGSNGLLASPDVDLIAMATRPATQFGPGALAPSGLTTASDSLFTFQEGNPAVAGISPMPTGLPAAAMTMPLQSFQRTVDDMGHQMGHQQLSHHPAHHQRSLSLREVAPGAPGFNSFMPMNVMPSSFAFTPDVKMENDSMQAGFYVPEMASPSTLGHFSPTSSAVSSSVFDHHSPRQEKKRRLTVSADMKAKKGAQPSKATGKAGGKGNGKGTEAPKKVVRRRSNTSASKGDSKSEAMSRSNSLIENTPAATQAFSIPVNAMAIQAPTPHVAPNGTSENSVSNANGEPTSQDASAKKAKGTNKRPPPSASQVTESGMPFPVIDTSAKHSSLFVPPDMSGLTKREERLVKNRAAAFLSRQRKREQFEDLEGKCRCLSRIVWRLWEESQMYVNNKAKSPFADRSTFSHLMMVQEGADAKQVFDDVLTLKGGSIAPMEDGQLQGAVAIGIQSANGKIIGGGDMDEDQEVTSVPAQPQVEDDVAANELAQLRSELDACHKREADLRTQLSTEHTLRLKAEFEADQRLRESQPFRVRGDNNDPSLTVAATFDEADEDEEEVDANTSLASANSQLQENGRKRRSSRGGGASRPSRASQRLQRQQPSSIDNGNQRKAASAALMMVLFSFALFGMPGGGEMGSGTGMRGGIAHSSRSGNPSNPFPLGRVLGAPLIEAHYPGDDEEDEVELGHLPPSSHLSAIDLFPSLSSQSMRRDFLAHDDDGDEEMTGTDDKARVRKTLRDVFEGRNEAENAGEMAGFNVDYNSFARDLGKSLEWDMQRGFIVLGSGNDDDEHEEDKEGLGSGEANKVNFDGASQAEGQVGKDVKQAPTKLTLFVPAPSEMASNSPEADSAEDRFYDAPLIDELKGSSSSEGAEHAESSRELTQAEATRAALQVLRNHRVACEAAAFAASRRFKGVQDCGSSRASSPAAASSSIEPAASRATAYAKGGEENDAGKKKTPNEQDDSQPSPSPSDRIRGTDFYQLEFSLSGAKVRNVAELARLFGSMRSKIAE